MTLGLGRCQRSWQILVAAGRTNPSIYRSTLSVSRASLGSAWLDFDEIRSSLNVINDHRSFVTCNHCVNDPSRISVESLQHQPGNSGTFGISFAMLIRTMHASRNIFHQPVRRIQFAKLHKPSIMNTSKFSKEVSPIRCLHSGVRLNSQWCNGDAYRDPADDLRPLLVTPLYGNSEGSLYRATSEEMKRVDDMFRDHRRLGAVMRVVNNYPDITGPEVCFIGRSNVGKSSLIRALFFEPENVKIVISKTPGRTRTLNFYRAPDRFTLVDVPGYGFNMPDHYTDSVENYIGKRENLVRIFLLIDAVAGLTPMDKIGIEMLQELGKPFVLVLTKIDKSSQHKVLRGVLELSRYREDKMLGALPQVFLVSSLQRVGLSLLRAFIAHITGADSGHAGTMKQERTQA